MAPKAGKRAKSEALSLRLDPKNRFILEFLSRLRGQTITTVLERAIIDAAESSNFEDSRSGLSIHWRSIYSPSEGARALAMAEHDNLYPTYDEDRRLAFAKQHWVFFYKDRSCTEYNLEHLEVIWPRIDEFMEIHDEVKNGGDFHASGYAMRATLENAGMDVPSWPQPGPKQAFSIDKDDEIPF